MKTLLKMAALSSVCFAGAAHAVDFTIDDFSTGQPAVSDTTLDGMGEFGAVSGPGIAGMERDLWINKTVDLTATQDAPSTISIATGALGVSNGPDTRSVAQVTWDGVDGDAAVDVDGLGGLNVTSGGLNDTIVLEIGEADRPWDYTLRIWDTDSATADTVSGTGAIVPFGSPTELTFDFTQFANIDFENLGAIQLEVESDFTGFDLVVDFVITSDRQTPPPPPGVSEPGTLALLGLGLAGAAAARRRRA